MSTNLSTTTPSVLYGNKTILNAVADPNGSTYGSMSLFYKNGNTIASSPAERGMTIKFEVILPIGTHILMAAFNAGYVAENSNEVTVTVTGNYITISAQNAIREYNVANPAFTYTVAGLVNGDTPQSVGLVVPPFATLATLTSLPGDYDINISAPPTVVAKGYMTQVNSNKLNVVKARQNLDIQVECVGGILQVDTKINSKLPLSIEFEGPVDENLRVIANGEVKVKVNQEGNDKYLPLSTVIVVKSVYCFGWTYIILLIIVIIIAPLLYYNYFKASLWTRPDRL